MITTIQIRSILPAANPVRVATLEPYFQKYMPIYRIDTPVRIGAFIAQVGHESDNLRSFVEYASGDEYDTRTDLGNTPEKDGDGRRYKGRGLIQITGKYMYHACSMALYGDDRLIEHPELLEQYEDGVHSACWFWEKVKDLNKIADMPETWIKPGKHGYTKFQWITVLINGGLNGYAERLSNYNRAKKVLNF